MRFFLAVGLLIAALSPSDGVAGIINGPAMTGDVTGNSDWGIRFTALANGTLDGFDYHTQGFAGTIRLRNANDNSILHSYAHAALSTVSLSNLGWALTANSVYDLVGIFDGVNNGRQANFNVFPNTFPVSNADISVTSGIFSGNVFTAIWGSFNNIATNQIAAVPEPGSASVLAGVLIAGAAVRRRKKSLVA